MLVVIAYSKKYEPLWQILDSDYTVIKQYRTRQEALNALEAMNAAQ